MSCKNGGCENCQCNPVEAINFAIEGLYTGVHDFPDLKKFGADYKLEYHRFMAVGKGKPLLLQKQKGKPVFFGKEKAEVQARGGYLYAEVDFDGEKFTTKINEKGVFCKRTIRLKAMEQIKFGLKSHLLLKRNAYLAALAAKE